MFKLITKAEYWSALDNKSVYNLLNGGARALDGLKHIQDYWMLSQLIGLHGLNICEIGGANSRLLPPIKQKNKVWNVDKFEGAGNGPTTVEKISGVNYIFSDLGEFSEELPNGFFDVVFSISVIEHIPSNQLFNFWKDHHRILKPGGKGFHVIDLYINDNPNPSLEEKIKQYEEQPISAGMRFSSPPSITKPVIFTSDLASNSDWGMWRWNKIAPSLQKKREVSQSVSLAMMLTK